MNKRMKIATWNVERLKHIKELTKLTETCKQVFADIFVLTETDAMLNLDYKFCVQTPTPIDAAVPYRSTENRVAIYTNYEIERKYDTFDEIPLFAWDCGRITEICLYTGL